MSCERNTIYYENKKEMEDEPKYTPVTYGTNHGWECSCDYCEQIQREFISYLINNTSKKNTRSNRKEYRTYL